MAALVCGSCTIGSGVSGAPTPRTMETSAADPTHAAPTRPASPASRPNTNTQQAGTCHLSGTNPLEGEPQAVSCADWHQTETFATGLIRDVAPVGAEVDLPSESLIAQVDCASALDTYLGTPDWVATRLRWSVVMEPASLWEGADSWWRCDLYVVSLHTRLAGEPYAWIPGVAAETVYDGLEGAGSDFLLDTYGQCVTYEDATEDTDLRGDPEHSRLTDCAEAHDLELLPGAFALDAYADAAEPPDETAIDTEAADRCASQAEAFVGAVRDELTSLWIAPSDYTWQHGDRAIACGVETVGGRVAGSVEGIGADPVDLIPYGSGDDTGINGGDIGEPASWWVTTADNGGRR